MMFLFRQVSRDDMTYKDHDEESQLNSAMKQIEDMLSESSKSEGSVGRIEWIQDKNAGLVTKRKPGKEKHYLGFKEDGQVYLLPEEVVAALELHDYQVVDQVSGIPMSLRQAYSFCLPSTRDLMMYHVYKDLRIKGFEVRRRRQEVTAEKRLASEDRKEPSAEEPSPKKRRTDFHTELFPLESMALSQDMLRMTDQDVLLTKDPIDWQSFKESSRKKLKVCSEEFSSVAVKFCEDFDKTFETISLPNACLSTDNICPVYSIKTLETFENVMRSLQENGPQAAGSSKEVYAMIRGKEEFESFEIQDKKKKRKAIVIPKSLDEDLPSTSQLRSLTSTKETKVIIAVYDVEWAVIKYFQTTPFKIWTELPEAWSGL